MFVIKNCDCYELHLPIQKDKVTKGNRIYDGCFDVDKLNCSDLATTEFYSGDMAQKCYSKCPVID